MELTMNMILQATPEDFRDLMINQTLGVRSSLQNILQAQYEQCKMVKDALLELKRQNKVPKEDLGETNKSIEDLYVCMQLIEDRYNILKEIG